MNMNVCLPKTHIDLVKTREIRNMDRWESGVWTTDRTGMEGSTSSGISQIDRTAASVTPPIRCDKH